MRGIVCFIVGCLIGAATVIGWGHINQPSEYLLALEELERKEAARDAEHREVLAAARQR